MSSTFKPGDAVICRMNKVSNHPGPRALDVHPAPHGEEYAYQVDKLWRVAEVRPDGKLVLRTRRGKSRLMDSGDKRLRHAHWWERLLYWNRFPRFEASVASN